MNGNQTAKRLVAKSRITNAKADASDRSHGFGAPPDYPPDLLLRTAMGAIACGLEHQDFNAVAEGYVMLIDLHTKIQGTEFIGL